MPSFYFWSGSIPIWGKTSERILETKKKLNSILASLTSKSINQINKDTDRDYYMDAKNAVKYGLVDKII